MSPQTVVEILVTIVSPDGTRQEVAHTSAPIAEAEPAWVADTFQAPVQAVEPKPEFPPIGRASVPPNCNIHRVPMKPSTKRGIAWYCTRRNADGTFCRELVAA